MLPVESPPPTRDVASDSRDRRPGFGGGGATLLLSVGVCWALFLGLSLVRWPIPGINETHYLAKAKHFADPGWITGDFFLNSSNPHAATSWLLGQFTSRGSFETSALLGRILAFGVLAAGWATMLCRRLPTARERLLATLLFVVLQIAGNWSGEWLLRGVEGKVFAWGFLFLAIGLWSGGTALQRFLAGVALGASVTFHPVIGAWGAIAAALSFAWGALDAYRFGSSEDAFRTDTAGTSATLSFVRSLIVPVIAFGVCAAPGIVAALPALRLGTADERWQADHIQITQRLAHHLDPGSFAWASHREYLLLLAAIWLLRREPRDGSRGRWSPVERMAWMAVLCAVGGIVVSLWPRTPDPFSWYVLRLKLLKLYPFRLADIFVPLLLAIRLVEFPRFETFVRTSGRTAALAAGLLAVAFLWPGDEGPARRMSAADYAHWQKILGWIREQTPRGAILQAMNEDFAIKWYAERAEFVNYKDCPQDAPGIFEWHRRLTQLDQEWRTPAMADSRVSPAELEELHRLTGIDYLICSRFGPVESRPVYASGPFRIYATHSQPDPATKE